MIRVLVVADGAALRTRIAAELAGDDRLEVVALARGDLPLNLRSAGPDVVVAAVDTGDERATARLLSLAAEVGAPPVVAVVDHEPYAGVAVALRAGVRAVMPRDAAAVELRAAVSAVAAGLVVVPADAAGPVAPSAAGGTGSLTPRERQVLDLLAEGLSNKAIAARLAIRERTVKFHIGAIFEKLDVTSRTEAVTAALRRGLILL